MPIDEAIREQALDWAVRAGDPGFQDWEGFILWLEQSPLHARAYDEACAAVRDAAELLWIAAPANDDAPEHAPLRRRSGAPWLAGTLAASLALIAGVAYWHGTRPDLYRVETLAGQTRTIALDEGSRVELAGGTLIELDRHDPRHARLEHGQALFTVRHDPAKPFRVAVGDETLLDVGTVFDVRQDAGDMAVAVAEGAVQFNPDGENVRVSPGHILRKSRNADATLAPIPAEQVGEWRQGRLTFTGTSLNEVAADLTRASGITFITAPNATGEISGSILIAPVRKDPRALGPLLGVEVHADGNRWVIGTR